ncbi:MULTISPECIES: GNAT family N-acetyltransferase [unclassified Tolypothrix]|uniref:GNAT family N-acetyltransferase n=1 Tax=unclassified Tolypothrix TaxID=2649714 RepID=UPI0005EAA5B4|nr:MULTISPECIES: N-acetyltransferase [unclassified Tolypothrix]BAY91976.1 N-acetyltransferase GCN5 [Microchaete diplosiphon NIES-3275]EKF04840.1 GNAT family acetyltransferase [Tolypothrix sp. PCC 7601]MBE9083788.1 N-acetyltransferase [Tolypothrix sp. LEGE 11397]UYD25970.1 N-acetyltransferase [Tolypothrix sp. PCC 7712]UYD31792.1 N-acetyltransferase [Tolypothrix sp. PCC 7601]
MNITIRKEVPGDVADIEALTTAAFLNTTYSSHTEQLIVNALRDSGNLTISLVAEADSKIVGHVAVSPVSISDGSQGWYGLGPISVSPQHQGVGIGSQLMREALATLRQLGASGCVLLGNPNYYSRFGFQVEPSLVLPDVPPEYFQAISFNGQIPTGLVSYHESFNIQV